MFSLRFYIELYQFFWPNQPKKRLIEIIHNAENLTFGSGTTNTAPAHPHRRGPLNCSDFFRQEKNYGQKRQMVQKSSSITRALIYESLYC